MATYSKFYLNFGNNCLDKFKRKRSCIAKKKTID